MTFLLFQAHPGCGSHAGGKGYNSRGNYCVGWAGNCGDGGVGVSSWYLVCDICREKYLRTKRQTSNKKSSRKKTSVSSVAKITSPAAEAAGNYMMI